MIVSFFFSFLPILPRCRSTFAQDYSTYWVGVESPPVNVRKRSIDVLTSSTPISTLRTTTPPYYSPTVDYEVSILRPITSRPLITRQTCFSHPIIITATDHRLSRERAGEVKSCPNIEIIKPLSLWYLFTIVNVFDRTNALWYLLYLFRMTEMWSRFMLLYFWQITDWLFYGEINRYHRIFLRILDGNGWTADIYASIGNLKMQKLYKVNVAWKIYGISKV